MRYRRLSGASPFPRQAALRCNELEPCCSEQERCIELCGRLYCAVLSCVLCAVCCVLCAVCCVLTMEAEI